VLAASSRASLQFFAPIVVCPCELHHGWSSNREARNRPASEGVVGAARQGSKPGAGGAGPERAPVMTRRWYRVGRASWTFGTSSTTLVFFPDSTRRTNPVYSILNPGENATWLGGGEGVC
jgi:hypothetical protein